MHGQSGNGEVAPASENCALTNIVTKPAPDESDPDEGDGGGGGGGGGGGRHVRFGGVVEIENKG